MRQNLREKNIIRIGKKFYKIKKGEKYKILQFRTCTQFHIFLLDLYIKSKKSIKIISIEHISNKMVQAHKISKHVN